MSTTPPVETAERWVSAGPCPCGCSGPWWATADVVGSQRGKGPARRTDDQIKAVIEAVLTDDPWLDASGVQVSVQQGIAALTGPVSSRAAKRRAEALVDRVGGVRDVQNSLQITG